jgi:MraZ protein
LPDEAKVQWGRVGVVDQPVRYSGKGFSLRGEKNRFMLPASLRKDVIASSGGERILCLVSHDRWPCLIGFGRSRVETFDAYLDREEEKAMRMGREFDRDARSMLLYGYEEVPFDASGRFVLGEDLADMGKIGDAIFFHGAGEFFTLWNPDELHAMGPELAAAQVSCRKWQADAAKGKRK